MKTDRELVSEQFGRNLAEARGWARLSQGELAKRVSLQQGQVAQLERGSRCPRLDVIVRLADVLEVQVRDLLYGIE